LAAQERTLEECRALVEPTGNAHTREVTIGATNGGQPPWKVLEFRCD
jgi:hypothetical protein